LSFTFLKKKLDATTVLLTQKKNTYPGGIFQEDISARTQAFLKVETKKKNWILYRFDTPPPEILAVVKWK